MANIIDWNVTCFCAVCMEKIDLTTQTTRDKGNSLRCIKCNTKVRTKPKNGGNIIDRKKRRESYKRI